METTEGAKNTGKKPQEPRKDRFKRLAALRTNAVLKRIKVLGNCANRQIYEYTEEDVQKIFSEIERKLRETKAKFRFTKQDEFTL